MPETLLVTGGAGYVGSHCVHALLERGHQVVVYDNLYQGHRASVPKAAKLIVGDLADKAALRAAFAGHGFSGILHFASNALVGESMTKPGLYLGDNVQNAVNVLDAAAEHGVKRFVLSSTCALFGEPERVPIDEDVRIAPGSAYGESKYLIERILPWYEKIHGLRFACLRYFNAAGAHPTAGIGEDHDPETHLIPIALDCALGKRPHMQIFGEDYPTPDGTCIRDYIHVCDLADAHLRVLGAIAERSRYYNVGIGKGYSVKEVLDAVKKVTGVDFPVKVGPRRPGDPPQLVANSARIQSELGWKPRFPGIEEIVSTAWAWRKANPDGYPKS
jgi:UDP-glucose 4-epimerase